MPETEPNAGPLTQAVGTGAVYAGFWLRFVAWVIDLFLSSAAAIPVALLGAIPYLFFANEAEGDPNEIMHGISAAYTAVYAFAVVSAGWFYFIIFECSKLQATPGKLALGLKVTDEHGDRITFPRSAARTASKILSTATMMIGYILAGLTPRKQALHDLIAGCLVIHAPHEHMRQLPPPVASLPASSSIEQIPPPINAEPIQAQIEQAPPEIKSEEAPSPLQSEPVPPGEDNQSIQLQQSAEPDPISASAGETENQREQATEPPNETKT